MLNFCLMLDEIFRYHNIGSSSVKKIWEWAFSIDYRTVKLASSFKFCQVKFRQIPLIKKFQKY